MGSLKKPKKRMEKNLLEIPEMQGLLTKAIELRNEICGFLIEDPDQYTLSKARPGRRECYELNLKTALRNQTHYYYTDDLIKSIKTSSPFTLIFPSNEEMDMFYELGNELINEIYVLYKEEYGRLLSDSIKNILERTDKGSEEYEEEVENFLDGLADRITVAKEQYQFHVTYEND